MHLERYELNAEQSLKVFEFTSEGPKGRISKIVQFGETNLKGLYNLAFGDKDPITGEITDGMDLCNRQHKSKNKTISNGVD